MKNHVESLATHSQPAVVLVETSESLNVGSVSRSMMNFGFSELRLVAPVKFSLERAQVTACGATEPLHNLSSYDSLGAALSDRESVVGFSARDGKNRGKVLSLAEWLEEYRNSPASKTAVVFGPEDNGLRQEHVELCSHLVHIPTSEAYPSMNLAQAVTLTLYGISAIAPAKGEPADLAEWKEFEQLDLLIRECAEMSGFFHPGTPQPLPSVLKTIFRRLKLSRREMAILLGLFGTTSKALAGKVPIKKIS